MDTQDVLTARVNALESRVAALEMRISSLEGGSSPIKLKRKKELTLEQRQQIRQRLVAGKEQKQKEREATIIAEARKANKQKGVKNGPPETTD